MSGQTLRGAKRRLAIMLATSTVVLLAVPASRSPVWADASAAPFAVQASAGPQAGARVDARVTLLVDGRRVTLPGAVVPALEPGDVVDVRFPDYVRPPARANYHVNVAFITEVAPQRWLFEQSGPADRLFAAQHAVRPRRGRPATPAPAPGLRFVYGTADHRGIPIVFIVPEDGKTRGMDGVRDYVDAHPTDFKNMAQSSNDAADRYVWFTDFLSSLADGSIDPVSARQRVETITTSLGANPAAVDGCYSTGGTSAAVAECIQTQLSAVSYQTNIEAPTQAQFFGGAVGAAAPVQLASYLIPLLSVWKLFAFTGHKEFEYLPTSLMTARASGTATSSNQLLMGLKVPALRPPAAYSDALFFTIGDPEAAATPPTIANTSDADGVCEPVARFGVPLHLDRTSAFVHDTQLLVTPDGGSPYTIPIDPRAVDAPVLDARELHGATDGAYTLALDGRFGFDPIRQPAAMTARLVLPQTATWSLSGFPHRPAISGTTLDVIASSAAAPCLTRAELQIGNEPPVPLELKHLSDRRVSLHASLANVPPGEAHVRLYQNDAVHDADIESAVALAIGTSPARVDPAKPPVVFLGDRSIELTGSELETVTALRLGDSVYTKDAGSNANEACFSGPPVGGSGAEAGQAISAQFVERDGSPGDVFVAKLAAPRPVLAPPAVLPDTPVHFSSEPLTVTLTLASDLPTRREIRVRHALPEATPCAAFRADVPAYAVVPSANSYERSSTSLAVRLDAAAALDDRAFGTLQIQLADTASSAVSEWVALPGRFLRAPHVTRIECPLDPAAPTCTLLGTGLNAIAAIAGDGGALVAPDSNCRSNDKNLACLAVPRRAQYVLELADEHARMTLPAALITAPPAAPPR